MGRKTAFNPAWKNTYSWINAVPGDDHSAFCKVCKKIFSVAAKGQGNIKEHAETEIHKKNEQTSLSHHKLQHYFSRKYINFFHSRIVQNDSV